MTHSRQLESSLLLTIALAVCLDAQPAAAQAPVSVAVGDVHGSGAAPALRDALEGEPGVVVVPRGEARFVLEARLRGRRARRVLSLRLVEGDVEIGRATVRVGARAIRARSLVPSVHALVAALPCDVGPQPEAAPPAPAPSPPPSAPPTPPPSRAFGDDPALLTVTLSSSLRSRDARITLSNGDATAFGASPYFELGGSLEGRPLAHEASFARGLYVRGEASGAVGLAARSAGNDVAASFFHALATVGYVLPLDPALELGGGVGGGIDAYQLSSNPVMPSAEYPFVRLEGRARVRLVGEALVLSFEGGYRALVGRGALGASFGPAGDSYGWDLRGVVSGVLDFGGYFAVEGGYVGYVHAFAGGDATRGTDGGYLFSVSLGWAVR